MAVAAFRSTTKRHCHLSTSEKDGTSFSVTSHKGGHRRTKSFTDSSCPYFSDSSSSSGYRTRSFSRHHSSDAESDADGCYRNHPKKSHDATQQRDRREEPHYMTQLQRHVDKPSGYESASSFSKHKKLSNYQNISQISRQNISIHTLQHENKQDFEDVSQMQEIEERTIRAVHAQTKILQQFQRDPPVEDVDVSSLYQMMRAEVKRAVEDLKKEFHESLEQKRSNSQTSEESFDESIVRPVQSNPIEDASSVSINYAAKLHQSKQRTRELRLQLEEEERRSAELAKSVGGLQLDTGSVKARRTRRGTDRQMVSRSLDEDARKYFEECVDILKLENLEAESSFSDGPGTAQNFSTLSKSHAVQRLPQEHLLQLNEIDHVLMDKESKTVKRRPVNADGVVMPWLDWESDIDADSTRSDSKQVNEKLVEVSNECFSISNVPVSYGSSTGHVSGCNTVKRNCFSSTTDINSEKSVQICKKKAASDGFDSSMIFTSSKDNSVTQNSFKMQDCIQLRRHYPRKGMLPTSGIVECTEEEASMLIHDSLLSQKTLFRSRIAQGRMLLCGGKL